MNNSGLELPAIFAKQGPLRKSCVFHFLENYKWDHIISNSVIKVISPIPESRSFILKLDPSNGRNIFESQGFDFYDRHITIFENFGTSESKLAKKNLLTHWHYTERYRKGSSLMELHLYYHYSEELSAHIRINKGPNNILTMEQPLKILRKNAEPACNIVYNLINALIYERDKATINYKKLTDKEKDLSFISSRTVEQLEQFLVECEAASQTLNNLTEDEEDCTIEQLRIKITKLKELKQSEILVAIEEKAPLVSEAATTELQNKTAKNVKAKKVDYQELIAKIKERVETLEAEYVKQRPVTKLIALEKEKHELLDELTIIYCEIEQTNNKQQALLKQTNALFDRVQQIKDLFESVKEQAFAGEINDEIKQKYLYIKNSIPRTFYSELIIFIANIINNGDENGYVEWLEFLYAESDDYRKFCAIIPIICASDDDAHNFSLMYCIALKQYTQLFKLLVQQTNQPDIMAFTYDNNKVLLGAGVACLDRSGVMLESLLNQDVVIEIEPQIFDKIMLKSSDVSKVKTVATFFSKDSKKADPGLAKAAPKVNSPIMLNATRGYASIPSLFYSYCQNKTPRVDLMQRLMLGTNNLNLLLGFAFLLSVDRVASFPSKNDKKMTIFTDGATRNLAMAQVTKDKSLGATSLCYYALTAPNLINVLPVVHSEVEKRMALLNDQQKDNLAKALLSLAEQQESKQNFTIAITACNASIYVTNYRSPTAEMHQKIVNNTLKLIYIHQQDTNSVLLSTKQARIDICVQTINNFINYSIFSSELKNPLLIDGSGKKRNLFE